MRDPKRSELINSGGNANDRFIGRKLILGCVRQVAALLSAAV